MDHRRSELEEPAAARRRIAREDVAGYRPNRHADRVPKGAQCRHRILGGVESDLGFVVGVGIVVTPRAGPRFEDDGLRIGHAHTSTIYEVDPVVGFLPNTSSATIRRKVTTRGPHSDAIESGMSNTWCRRTALIVEYPGRASNLVGVCPQHVPSARNT